MPLSDLELLGVGLAIEALERQIPKKPEEIPATITSGGGYACPSCHDEIKRSYMFCPYCGRALDWRD